MVLAPAVRGVNGIACLIYNGKKAEKSRDHTVASSCEGKSPSCFFLLASLKASLRMHITLQQYRVLLWFFVLWGNNTCRFWIWHHNCNQKLMWPTSFKKQSLHISSVKSLGHAKYTLACFELLAQKQLFPVRKPNCPCYERFVNNFGKADDPTIANDQPPTKSLTHHWSAYNVNKHTCSLKAREPWMPPGWPLLGQAHLFENIQG